jgi:hypothetical protein
MAAIFCQRASDETLVPPNFRTIQGSGRNSFSVREDMKALCLCGAKKQAQFGREARSLTRRRDGILTGQ